MTPAEVAGLTKMASGMSIKDLTWQVNNGASTGVVGAALQIFKDELNKRKETTVTPAEHAMMGELNAYRKILKMKPAQFRGNSTALAEAVIGLAKKVLKLEPDNAQAKKRIVAPAVADGAYSSNREAVAKTSHTTNGKTASQTKKEAKMAKQIEKNVKTSNAKLQRAANDSGATTLKAKSDGARARDDRARTVADGEMHLSDIAKHIKMEPKHARARARKNAAAIAKLEVKGKKYVFVKANRDKVAAILKG